MTEAPVVMFVVQSVSLIWLLFLVAWAFVVWFAQGSRGISLFRRRFDQLLVLLLPQAEADGPGTFAGLKKHTARVSRRRIGSGGARARGAARRWRAPLGAVYAQGYQVASETISPPAEVVHSGELVRETVEALRAERARGGATVPAVEDPVVVLAYGLGAWPPGADLTSLEELLGELGVSHGVLRDRFESLLRTIAPTHQNREFRELAGASFVLGASTRIVEAAYPPAINVPPPGWLAALTTPQRSRNV